VRWPCYILAYNAGHDIAEKWKKRTYLAIAHRPSAADLNGDGVVDLADFAVFTTCLTGPEVAVVAGCEPADLDLDADVDLADFSVMQDKFGTGL
jgi:hypothetical protein